MAEPLDYRAVFASLMPNLFSQLQISPEENTLSERELRDIHRLLALEKEREEGNSGDGGNRSNNLNSNINKSSVLMPQTTSDSNIERVKESLLRKESLTSSLYFNGKENVPSSEVLHRNRLSRRERSSRMTSRRKPFVVDLKNLDTSGSGECQKIKDVHAFWEAAEERDAAEAIINKLKRGTEISSELSSRKLGERRKNSQRKTSRLRGFSVELSSCVEQTIEVEEQRDSIEDSCFTSSANTQLTEDHIPISQIVDSIQSDVEFETMACLDQAKSNLTNDVDIFSSTISSSCLHLDLPSVTISSPHMDLNDDIDNNRKATDCKDTRQVSEIALQDQVEELENRSAFASEGIIPRNVAEFASEIDVIVVTPFVMRKKAQLNPTPYTSPTPPPNPLAGICFREEDNKRRLDFADQMHSSNLEERQLPLDLDTSDWEKPQMPLDPGSSHLEPIDNVDAMDSSDLEPELPISTNIRKAENILASSTTVEDIIEERPSTEFSATTLPIKRTLQSPTSSFAGPVKKNQNKKTGAANRKGRIAEPRRNSLAAAGTQWDVGVRRSTRIRSKPLEWWKGERFLLGRVHKSLVTVIGIKYTSNSPCDPKKGATNPKFKVESYVPEEFSKYVKFAAL